MWLFAGKVVCGVCDSAKMYVPSKSVKFTCQKCRNEIAVDDLEEVFKEQLRNFLFSPDEISRLLEDADETVADLFFTECAVEAARMLSRRPATTWMANPFFLTAFGKKTSSVLELGRARRFSSRTRVVTNNWSLQDSKEPRRLLS